MMPWITPALRRVGAAAARRRPLAATQGQRPPPHRLASSSSTHASGASHPLPQALLLTAAAASTTAVAVALCSASLEEEGSAQAAAGPGPHYDRVDTKLGRAYPEFLKFHLIHETLRGKEKIEAYEVYKDKRDDSVVAFARLGKLLSGHPDIIHGGSIAALLDNTMGVAFFAAKVSSREDGSRATRKQQTFGVSAILSLSLPTHLPNPSLPPSTTHNQYNREATASRPT